MKFLLYLVVGFHYFIFAGLCLSLILCWTELHWYFACTVSATVVRIALSREICPLTLLENRLRLKLGLSKSRGFIKDWILFRRNIE